MIKNLTCIECPIGCQISVTLNDSGVIEKIEGNSCPRGKAYAENEVICPKRVLTTTVKTASGKVVPVKTDKPVKKEDLFKLLKIINETVVDGNKNSGDIIIEKIDGEANVILTANMQ